MRQHLALVHIDSSSSDEYDSDFESLVSSDEEVQESTFFDFSEAPSKVEYEVVDRLNRHDVTVPTNASFVREKQKKIKLENYDGDDEEEEIKPDHFDIDFSSSEDEDKDEDKDEKVEFSSEEYVVFEREARKPISLKYYEYHCITHSYITVHSNVTKYSTRASRLNTGTNLILRIRSPRTRRWSKVRSLTSPNRRRELNMNWWID